MTVWQFGVMVLLTPVLLPVALAGVVWGVIRDFFLFGMGVAEAMLDWLRRQA